MRTKLLMGALFIGALSVGVPGIAQEFPTKPITIIVPFGAGGGGDVAARWFAERMSPVLGQPVIVENKPGAGGAVGSAIVAEAEPDGYTLLAHGGDNLSNVFYANLPLDPDKLTPVATTYGGSFNLIVASDFPADDLAGFVQYAKDNPDLLNYGTANPVTMLPVEIFKNIADFDATMVNYGGEADVVTALLSGQIHFVLSTATAYRPHVDAGTMKVLAVTGETRSPLWENATTFAEAGYSEIVVGWQNGFWTTAGTPTEIVDKLSGVISEIADSEDARLQFLNASGAEASGSTPSEMAEKIDVLRTFWVKAAEISGFEPLQ